MSRITTLFTNRKDPALALYFTAGFPALDSTTETLQALEESAVDFIEIGIPYSDPMADGPTIQQTSQQALQNGMNLPLLFEQLKELRGITQKPAFLMGYLNNVLQYGLERFCAQSQACGIDGVILPDMPLPEYAELYQPVFQKYGLKAVFLVTSRTSEARIRQIDALSEAFIYLVSSASITGSSWQNDPERIAYLERIRNMQLQNPLMVGFGIGDAQAFDTVAQYADGGIIGSAYLRALQETGSIRENTQKFVNGIRKIHNA